MKRVWSQSWIFALIALFLGSTVTLAAPTKEELRGRFEQRYPQIKQAKSDGKIGETSTGLLEAVKSADSTFSKLIDEENADRRALYELIAKDEKVDADVVARRAAQRNFQKAKPGEYLKEDGKWRQK